MILNSTRRFPSLSSIHNFFSTLQSTILSPSPFSTLSPLVTKSYTINSSIHSSNLSPVVNFLHLLSTCRKIKDLLILKSQFIVRGLFSHETLVGKFLRLCFDVGDPELALLTFRRIENPSLFLQNLIIRCLYDHELYEHVLSVYTRCQFLGCPSDNFTFPFVIKSCSVLGAVGKGKEIHCVVLRTGFEQNLVVQTGFVDFYAKIAEVGIARLLHDRIPQRDLVSWNALLSGYSLHGLNEEVFEVFRQMRATGLNPNVSTFASIIPVCSRFGDLYIGKSLHGFVLKIGYFMSEFLMPALISMYASNGDLSVAKEIFDSIPRKNVTMWNAMISAYTQNQKSYDSIELFKNMSHYHIQPNLVTFVCIIPSSENIGNIGYGESLHAYVIKLGLQNQIAVITVLLSMYAKLGELDSAKLLFVQMPHRNLLSWNSMVSGYVRNGHWTSSLAAICDMQTAGINPDAVSIVSILSSCSKLKATLPGKSAHSFSLKRGIDLNLNVSNALLAFYSDCCKITCCFNLFNKMPTRDIVSWNTLISGCVHCGEDEHAVFLLQKMQQEKIDMDLVTLISILPCHNKPENLVQGMTVHGFVIKLGLASDVSLANALISMYMNCGELDSGKLIFENMANREVISWNSLITGYRSYNLRKEVILLLARMIEEDQKPSHVTLLNVLPICYTHMQGKSIHGYAARRGFVLETSFLTSLILMYGRFENINSSSLLFQMGEKENSNISLWNAIITTHVQSQNPKKAFYLFSDLLRMETRPDYVTILSLTSACVQLNHLNLTSSIMGYVIRKGFDKFVAVSNAFIDLHARCGNISCARKLFDDLPHKDSISWSVMINAYSLHGDGETAVALFKQMRNLSLEIDDTTYISILSACSHAGLVDEGWMVFNSILNQGIFPRMEHYSCMVDLLGRTGHLNEAYNIVKSLQHKSVSMLESLLGSCLIHGSVELGEEIGKLLLKMDPENSGMYVILYNIYAAAGRWTEANKVRSEMELKNLTKVPGFSLVEGHSFS